jgi:Rrf2 family iron-sulfur cluster assembly transcriptional regulator
MRLTTKGRFAVTAMLDVAMRQHAGPVALSAIGKRHQISVSYLEQLFSRLRRAGLVMAVRGPGGGYVLEREASHITVADVVASVDDAQTGRDETGGPAGDDAMTRDLWTTLGERMASFMASVSLQKLVDDQVAKGVKVEPVTPVKSGVLPRPAHKPLKINAPNSVFALASAFNKS